MRHLFVLFGEEQEIPVSTLVGTLSAAGVQVNVLEAAFDPYDQSPVWLRLMGDKTSLTAIKASFDANKPLALKGASIGYRYSAVKKLLDRKNEQPFRYVSHFGSLQQYREKQLFICRDGVSPVAITRNPAFNGLRYVIGDNDEPILHHLDAIFGTMSLPCYRSWFPTLFRLAQATSLVRVCPAFGCTLWRISPTIAPDADPKKVVMDSWYGLIERELPKLLQQKGHAA